MLSLGFIFSIRKEVSDLAPAMENSDVPHMLGRNSTGLMATSQPLGHHRVQLNGDAPMAFLSHCAALWQAPLLFHLSLSVCLKFCG